MFAFSPAARTALLLALCCAAPAVYAVGTAAGSDITNTASATFTDPGGTPRTVSSNTATLRVDEILDVTVVANDAANVAVTTPASDRVLSFTVTNTGNGSETYMLSTVANLGGDQFDPSNVRIYLDDGDNVFNSATDTLLVAGSNDPVLAADASVRIFVVSDIPSSLSDGDTGLVRLVAESKTAKTQTPAVIDTPGTAFAGLGTNGGDAVVGSTQAYASKDNGYAVAQVATSLAKSQSVLDPFGNANAVPGAVITYTLTFTASGSGNLTGAKIVDAIPAGTSYQPGTLTLDSVGLTDGSDADAGLYTGSQVEVSLPDPLPAPATHTVTFQVKIN